jgi:hypothetical protein
MSVLVDAMKFDWQDNIHNDINKIHNMNKFKSQKKKFILGISLGLVR